MFGGLTSRILRQSGRKATCIRDPSITHRNAERLEAYSPSCMELVAKVKNALKVVATSAALLSCDKAHETSPSLPGVPSGPSTSETKKNTDTRGPAQQVAQSRLETREVISETSLIRLAKNLFGDLAELNRVTMLNGIHPNTPLAVGSYIRCIPSGCNLPDVDRDPAINPVPVVVKLKQGHTLWYLADRFKVDLKTLIALNCAEGEREVRSLKPGRKIIIPMVQKITNKGATYTYLEGLCIQSPRDCERIAHRLLKDNRGMSMRLDHLSRAFQHFSPAERRDIISRIADGLESAAAREANSGDPSSSVGLVGKMYADALRAAVDTYSIGNPFRVSPMALLEIVERRRRLEIGDSSLFTEKILLVCTSNGDANGAFSSVNLVIEEAMKQGVSVLYFQCGRCSEIFKAGDRLHSVFGRGADSVIIAGHGAQASKHGAALLELGYSSTIQRLRKEEPAALQDLQLQGVDEAKLTKIAQLARTNGDVGFISCFSGENGADGANNLVNRLAQAAASLGHNVHVIGCREATNVKSVNLKGPHLQIEYLNGGTYERSVRTSTAGSQVAQ